MQENIKNVCVEAEDLGVGGESSPSMVMSDSGLSPFAVAASTVETVLRPLNV